MPEGRGSNISIKENPCEIKKEGLQAGVVISNIKIPCETMTIINGIRIKDRYVHNLPENRALLGYARNNRRAGNMAEIAFWKQEHRKMLA